MDAAAQTRAELLAAITRLYRSLRTAPRAEQPAIEAEIRALADRYLTLRQEPDHER